jgi:ubiquinone/menaquinone biosynthesis C-methylase UbiE
MEYSEATKTAQEYYNSRDADEFYYAIWGGEDIHVGIYETPDEAISAASRRTVERMLSMLPELGEKHRVLDLGSGYGGAARFLAQRTGCHVTCLNLSEVQNERNREANQKAGLDAQIDVIDGSFDRIPSPDEDFHAVWSEDAILHAGDRVQVVREVGRVLKPGGDFIFTDPMQSENCPAGVLQSVYDRIHLDSLASFGFYRGAAKLAALEEAEIVDLSGCLTEHYTRVKAELTDRYDSVVELATHDYVDRMLQGLQHWIDAGNKGYLTWGILHFTKPNQS